MGKLVIGILGGFRGTVGTVVGTSNRKGDDIIRAKTKRTRPQSTVSQQNQQTRFSLVTGFMKPLNFILKSGFKTVASGQMTPYNYACQKALKAAVLGDASNMELDYSNVLISDGLLSRTISATAEAEGDKVVFSWSDNADAGLCSPEDKAVMLVYNITQSEVSYSDGSVTRLAQTGSLGLPYRKSGDVLLCYLFFRSAIDEYLVSPSLLAGEITVE